MKRSQPGHIKSGGRRLDFYAELGRYFSPGGLMQEEAFRTFIRVALQAHLEEAGGSDEAAARNETGHWLSAHLEEIFSYLEERELSAAAQSLFHLAMDEAASLGVSSIHISPQRLRWILATKPVEQEEHERSRRHDPDGKREKIVAAALEIFSELGFHEATMDAIALRSQVAKGTLYRYFSSKDDLLEHLLRSTSQALALRFAAAFEGHGALLEKIEQFVISWVTYIEENHQLYRLVQNEGLSAPVGRQTMLYEYLLDDFPLIKERFVALDAVDAVKVATFHTVAYGVLGFIDGVARKWFRSGMDYPLHSEIPIILEVLFHGFVRDDARNKIYYVPPEEESRGKNMPVKKKP